MAGVKQPNKRTQRAQRTRRRVVEAARDLFVEQGYGGTLVPEVAEKAGVAVQTIYFSFGTKRALLKEVVDQVIAGDYEPVATMDRPWFRAALAADTAESMLRAYVDETCRVLHRVSPITRMLEAAIASDPEIAGLWSFDEDPRLTVHVTAAESLLRKPDAQNGLDIGRAADILFALLSPELYRLLVHDRGWTEEAFADWALASLKADLVQERDSARG